MSLATVLATNLLTATPAEAALMIACALTDPRDLLALAVAVPPRFANKCIAAPPPPRTAASAAEQQAETWSIIEEAARQWIAGCTDQEQGWVPRRGRESWLGLMWEVESLRRRGAVFGRCHADITLSEGGSRVTKATGGRRVAASKAVMRAGRHFLQLEIGYDPPETDYDQHGDLGVGDYGMLFGVIRPDWDVRRDDLPSGGQFFDTHEGRRYPGGCRWGDPSANRWANQQVR